MPRPSRAAKSRGTNASPNRPLNPTPSSPGASASLRDDSIPLPTSPPTPLPALPAAPLTASPSTAADSHPQTEPTPVTYVRARRDDNVLVISFPLPDHLECTEDGCDVSFKATAWTAMKMSLDRHLKSVHGLEGLRAINWCTFCDKQIVGRKPSCHPCLRSKPIQDPVAVRFRYACDTCDFTCPSKRGLTNHQKTHQRPPPPLHPDMTDVPASPGETLAHSEPVEERQEEDVADHQPQEADADAQGPAAIEEEEEEAVQLSPPSDHERAWLERLAATKDQPWEVFEALVADITAAISEKSTASRNAPKPAPRIANVVRPPRRNRDRAPPYDPKEAANLQKLFRSHPRKAMEKILGNASPYCEVPKEDVERHFQAVYGDVSYQPQEAGHHHQYRPTSDEEKKRMLARVTADEVVGRLSKATNTAPGPDCLTYWDLKAFDPKGLIFAGIFDRCLQEARTPDAWKISRTVLIYKKGDRSDLKNWRPLALSNTIAKLYAAIVADRVLAWATGGRRLSGVQKGFREFEGCHEHNFVLQTAVDEMRRRLGSLNIAWLDLSNAFGSIPHEHLRRTLTAMDMPSRMKDAVMEMQDCRTFVRTTEGDTGHIHLRAGVKQGCPLSPTLFNLGIEHVIRAAQEEAEVHGIRVLDTTISVLGYADDIVLVGKSADHLQALLDRVGVAATDAGLRFNPAKCSTLSLDFRTSQPVEPRQFIIQGGAITSLREGESYKYLGVPFGFRVCQTPREELQKLGEDVRKIDESLLAPWQKISATSTFLLSRLDFIIRAGNVRKTDLAPTDRLIKTCCKRWLNLPTRASNEIVYIHHRHGGAGLLPLTDLTDVLTVVHGYRLLNCRDPVVKKMAWGRLREVVKRKMKRMPSTADLMAYLSGNTEAPFGSVSGDFSSLFTQVRSASRRLRDRIALSWRWSDILNEPQIVLGGGEAASRVVVPPRAIGVLAKTLKNRVREAYLARLVAKPDQGKVFSASSVAAASSHFLVGGRYTRFCDWRFIHRARLDVLPLNACRRYDPSGDRRCRRCGYGDETLPHVLNHCTRHSLTWRRRHDSVLTRLTNAIMGRKGRSDEEVRINRTVPEVNSDLRPDILITDKKTMTARMIDVTIPFDNRRSALQEARRLKEEKYAGLAADLAVLGYSASVEGFVVGSLGSWDPENDRVLRGLGIPRRYAFLMKKLMVSDVIRWSRDLYVEHITGHRQYEDGIGGDG
ncbi:uncharacterized protein LOC124159815 [Ischnura elegans]|uniref:uncharacterized protein LOC124159815 n=1 Tax=Ischnura elegans TaxID=197161 RepID=UPI001ED87261|nr:uncharacterized protein LOC124159815 [Ischnura elegans]